MKARTFLLGALLGALVTLTFGATENRPSWEYKVQMKDLGYGSSSDEHYTKALNDSAANGWEVLCCHRVDYRNVEIVLRRPKQAGS